MNNKYRMLDYARSVCKKVTKKNGKSVGKKYISCVTSYGIDLEHENGDEVLSKARKYQEKEDIASDGITLIIDKFGIIVENPAVMYKVLAEDNEDTMASCILLMGIVIVTLTVYLLFR